MAAALGGAVALAHARACSWAANSLDDGEAAVGFGLVESDEMPLDDVGEVVGVAQEVEEPSCPELGLEWDAMGRRSSGLLHQVS